MNPRAVAATLLMRMELSRDDALAVDLLDRALKQHRGADPRDRGLLTELVYGVLRWQSRLDHALKPRVSQRFGQLEPLARALLRVGAYQLFFLDRIPARAAVDATQKAARSLGVGRFTGLLNAVLRRLVREGEQLPKGERDKHIALRCALPLWIVRELRYLSKSPADLEALAMGLRRRPQVTLRPTLTRGGITALREALGSEGFELGEQGVAGVYVVEGPGDPFGTKAFRDGLFVAQDPASLAVVDLAGDVAGKRVLDLCAGRGIKATALADRGAQVVAVDISADKLEHTTALARQLGLSDSIQTLALDPTEPGDNALTAEAPFDVVMVDAPCTGLGTIARRPEIAWRRQPEDVKRLAELQGQLLRAGAACVRPGGTLLYAVCTFTRIETRPGVPSGFLWDETQDTFRWRPDEGFDAFYAMRMQRENQP